MTLRVGVDTGGTFTDVCLYDAKEGRLSIFKTPSTPDDPGAAVLAGSKEAVQSIDHEYADFEYFAHGTTVATNALLEGKGAKVALLVTSGFRDLLELGRQMRPKLYDIYAQKPDLLVPRDRIIEVEERVKYDGSVILSLEEGELAELIQTHYEILSEADAIAVCYLYSFENPKHEEVTGKFLRHAFPEAFVTLSSEVLPQFREFERLSTTTINAYIGPIMQNYLRGLRERLTDRGLGTSPKVTQSNGGVLSFTTAEDMPVKTVLSGPSTGVVGASALAIQSGFPDIITLDVGGTSSDLALVNDGTPTSSAGMELDGRPIHAPMLDISTVGAGGGSIAWIDDGGLLKVGPQSAGAYPGPACYGNGNTEATVTDANVVLGILNNEFLLGGSMPINAELSFDAVGRLGHNLGLTVEQTAQGIVSVVTANMAKAIRVISVQKGYNPADYALVAFGGAGPLHSGRLAQELGMKTTLIPTSPGAMSAVGMLMTDLKSDFVSTVRTVLAPDSMERIVAAYRTLREEAEGWLEDENIKEPDASLKYFADLRYRGQNYELAVEVHDPEDTALFLSKLLMDFEKRHKELYGYLNPGSSVEVVNLRIQAVGEVERINLAARDEAEILDRRESTRSVYLPEQNSRVDVPVMHRSAVKTGTVLSGPLVIEQYDSTSFVLPGQNAVMDKYDMLVIQDKKN